MLSGTTPAGCRCRPGAVGAGDGTESLGGTEPAAGCGSSLLMPRKGSDPCWSHPALPALPSAAILASTAAWTASMTGPTSLTVANSWGWAASSCSRTGPVPVAELRVDVDLADATVGCGGVAGIPAVTGLSPTGASVSLADASVGGGLRRPCGPGGLRGRR